MIDKINLLYHPIALFNPAVNKSAMHNTLFLDIRADICPLTFVKTRLLLDTMQSGQVAELYISEGEAVQSLPVSVQELGHQVVQMEKRQDYYVLTLKKG